MIRLSAFSDEAGNSLKEQIEALKRNGISYMEIRNVDGVNVQKMTLEQAEEIQRELEANGISVWSVGSPVGKVKLKENFCFEDYLEDVRHICKLANIFKTDKIRMFSFFLAYDKAEEVYGYLRRMVEVAKEYGVQLYHENEKKIYGETAERCLNIHKAFPKVRAVFDPANFVQCDVDTLHAWELLKDYVEYMHIKDARADHVVVPAGQGLGNIAAIAKQYIAQGGQVFTMEPHLNIFAGLDKLENGESLKAGVQNYANNDEAFDAGVGAFKSIVATL